MENNIWIMSDTHFGHTNIIKLCGRPENHEQLMLHNLSTCLQKGDILIHLGDVAIGGERKWNQQLSEFVKSYGVKAWLIRGNHDTKGIGWYLECGWDFCADAFVLHRYGLQILFTHIPTKIELSYDLNIHGHLHLGEHRATTDWYSNSTHHLISMELQSYTPTSLSALIKSRR